MNVTRAPKYVKQRLTEIDGRDRMFNNNCWTSTSHFR